MGIGVCGRDGEDSSKGPSFRLTRDGIKQEGTGKTPNQDSEASRKETTGSSMHLGINVRIYLIYSLEKKELGLSLLYAWTQLT